MNQKAALFSFIHFVRNQKGAFYVIFYGLLWNLCSIIEFDFVLRYRPSYNVSPGFNLPVVRREDASDSEGYVLHCMKWGLIPSFTKKTEKPDHYKMVKVHWFKASLFTSFFFLGWGWGAC